MINLIGPYIMVSSMLLIILGGIFVAEWDWGLGDDEILTKKVKLYSAIIVFWPLIVVLFLLVYAVKLPVLTWKYLW